MPEAAAPLLDGSGGPFSSSALGVRAGMSIGIGHASFEESRFVFWM